MDKKNIIFLAVAIFFAATLLLLAINSVLFLKSVAGDLSAEPIKAGTVKSFEFEKLKEIGIIKE